MEKEITQFEDYELFDKMIEEEALYDDEPQEDEEKEIVVRKRGEGKSLSYKVEKGVGLLDFMFDSIRDKSKTTVRSYLKNNQVSVNGIPTTQFDKQLSAGDRVEINLGMADKTFRHPQLQIVYEDDYLLVVNKRNGLLTMATDRERQKTAYYILSEYLKTKNRQSRVFIVHRLDRETSGLVIFAKSIDIQHQLQQHWSEIVLERKYVAVVSGQPKQQSGEIRSYLAENKMYQVYSTNDPLKGELAITRYTVLARSKTKSLVELELETGKKNQIRVHLSDIGCPIIGDRKYGGESSDIKRVALHACKIRFIHPVTGKEMFFDTGIPSVFKKYFFFKK